MSCGNIAFRRNCLPVKVDGDLAPRMESVHSSHDRTLTGGHAGDDLSIDLAGAPLVNRRLAEQSDRPHVLSCYSP